MGGLPINYKFKWRYNMEEFLVKLLNVIFSFIILGIPILLIKATITEFTENNISFIKFFIVTLLSIIIVSELANLAVGKQSVNWANYIGLCAGYALALILLIRHKNFFEKTDKETKDLSKPKEKILNQDIISKEDPFEKTFSTQENRKESEKSFSLEGLFSIKLPSYDTVRFDTTLTANGDIHSIYCRAYITSIKIERENSNLTDEERYMVNILKKTLLEPDEDGSRYSINFAVNSDRWGSQPSMKSQSEKLELNKNGYIGKFRTGVLFFGYTIQLFFDNNEIKQIFGELNNNEQWNICMQKHLLITVKNIQLRQENSKKKDDGSPAILTSIYGDIDTITKK